MEALWEHKAAASQLILCNRWVCVFLKEPFVMELSGIRLVLIFFDWE